MQCLNLGCGWRFHAAWTNIDITSASPYVRAHDLRRGIPFSNNTFDVVYHSHLLEHFPKHEAPGFIQECYRVLKPEGIIRVAVPDLERIAQLYLQALDKALLGEEKWQHHYAWMMLELYDQTVRECTGGGMLQYLKQDPIPNEAFVYERVGGEARRLVQALQTGPSEEEDRSSGLRHLMHCIGDLPHRMRARLIRSLLGEDDYKALEIGRFRLRGQVHHWMYDRYSLAQLLKQAGFQNFTVRTASESAIDNWTQFNLDTEADGTVYKPDSLYLEAVKPAV